MRQAPQNVMVMCLLRALSLFAYAAPYHATASLPARLPAPHSQAQTRSVWRRFFVDGVEQDGNCPAGYLNQGAFCSGDHQGRAFVRLCGPPWTNPNTPAPIAYILDDDNGDSESQGSTITVLDGIVSQGQCAHDHRCIQHNSRLRPGEWTPRLGPPPEIRCQRTPSSTGGPANGHGRHTGVSSEARGWLSLS